MTMNEYAYRFRPEPNHLGQTWAPIVNTSLHGVHLHSYRALREAQQAGNRVQVRRITTDGSGRRTITQWVDWEPHPNAVATIKRYELSDKIIVAPVIPDDVPVVTLPDPKPKPDPEPAQQVVDPHKRAWQGKGPHPTPEQIRMWLVELIDRLVEEDGVEQRHSLMRLREEAMGKESKESKRYNPAHVAAYADSALKFTDDDYRAAFQRHDQELRAAGMPLLADTLKAAAGPPIETPPEVLRSQEEQFFAEHPLPTPTGFLDMSKTEEPTMDLHLRLRDPNEPINITEFMVRQAMPTWPNDDLSRCGARSPMHVPGVVCAFPQGHPPLTWAEYPDDSFDHAYPPLRAIWRNPEIPTDEELADMASALQQTQTLGEYLKPRLPRTATDLPIAIDEFMVSADDPKPFPAFPEVRCGNLSPMSGGRDYLCPFPQGHPRLSYKGLLYDHAAPYDDGGAVWNGGTDRDEAAEDTEPITKQPPGDAEPESPFMAIGIPRCESRWREPGGAIQQCERQKHRSEVDHCYAKGYNAEAHWTDDQAWHPKAPAEPDQTTPPASGGAPEQGGGSAAPSSTPARCESPVGRMANEPCRDCGHLRVAHKVDGECTLCLLSTAASLPMPFTMWREQKPLTGEEVLLDGVEYRAEPSRARSWQSVREDAASLLDEDKVAEHRERMESEISDVSIDLRPFRELLTHLRTEHQVVTVDNKSLQYSSLDRLQQVHDGFDCTWGIWPEKRSSSIYRCVASHEGHRCSLPVDHGRIRDRDGVEHDHATASGIYWDEEEQAATAASATESDEQAPSRPTGLEALQVAAQALVEKILAHPEDFPDHAYGDPVPQEIQDRNVVQMGQWLMEVFPDALPGEVDAQLAVKVRKLGRELDEARHRRNKLARVAVRMLDEVQSNRCRRRDRDALHPWVRSLANAISDMGPDFVQMRATVEEWLDDGSGKQRP